MTKQHSLFPDKPEALAEDGLSPCYGLSADNTVFIGVDEAGRGCLAGPVVAGAVILPKEIKLEECLPGLNDSKQLSRSKREALAPLIRTHALAYALGISWQDEIDTVNILNATFRAMSRAVSRFVEFLPNALLMIDGNHIIPEKQWIASFEAIKISPLGNCPKNFYELMNNLQLTGMEAYERNTIPPIPAQKYLIKGDSRCPAIAAASILAKTARDDIMQTLSPRFPEYGFNSHMGYGSAAHIKAIKTHGPCPLHRLTFKKVKREEEQGGLF